MGTTNYLYFDMCLYPRFMQNRKYTPTKKNGGCVPILKDWRIGVVPIGCGNCIECRQQKAREWQVRLAEQLKATPKAYFVTLTFSPKAIKELQETYKDIKDVNKLAKKGTRLFLERIRRKYKHSITHWFVTELGHTKTERIHMHGIIYTELDIKDLMDKWTYGNTWVGTYVSERTVNYIVKYIVKIDEDHKNYKSIILCSPGLGNTYNGERNVYRPNKTAEYYQLRNGQRVNLPIYYRNKIYTEEEREKLWIEKLDKGEIWVRGFKFDTRTLKGYHKYLNFMKEEQRRNKELGYGDTSQEWQQKNYEITFKMLQSGQHSTSSRSQNSE